MSDDATRTRFLVAIATQLPPARVIEIHLFGGIRQGGIESGVAVIAVDPDEPAPSEPEAAIDAPAWGDADVASLDVDLEMEMPDAVATPVAESVEAVLEEPVVQADGEIVDQDAVALPASDGDAADQATSDAGDHAGYDAPVDAADADLPVPVRAAARRYTVYTARYRLTLKGPDRGKWEASVTEEADAPLLTVDLVVRGVSRRSGDADETVRLSGDEFRAALPDPLPVPAPAARPRTSPARS